MGQHTEITQSKLQYYTEQLKNKFALAGENGVWISDTPPTDTDRYPIWIDTSKEPKVIDIDINNPVNNQVLTYEDGKWVNKDATGGSGTTNYNDLDNQPSINGVTLVGNKTTEDLGITGVEDYSELTNKPSINGVTLDGNKTTSDLGIDTGGGLTYESQLVCDFDEKKKIGVLAGKYNIYEWIFTWSGAFSADSDIIIKTNLPDAMRIITATVICQNLAENIYFPLIYYDGNCVGHWWIYNNALHIRLNETINSLFVTCCFKYYLNEVGYLRIFNNGTLISGASLTTNATFKLDESTLYFAGSSKHRAGIVYNIASYGGHVLMFTLSSIGRSVAIGIAANKSQLNSYNYGSFVTHKIYSTTGTFSISIPTGYSELYFALADNGSCSCKISNISIIT